MKYLLLCVMFVGCATVGKAPYQKRDETKASGFQIGYYENEIRKNVYEVGFLGTGHDSNTDVRKYFLRRSKEVAKMNNFKGFCVIKEFERDEGWGNVKWNGHAGDVRLTNDLSKEDCYSVQ